MLQKIMNKTDWGNSELPFPVPQPAGVQGGNPALFSPAVAVGDRTAVVLSFFLGLLLLAGLDGQGYGRANGRRQMRVTLGRG